MNKIDRELSNFRYAHAPFKEINYELTNVAFTLENALLANNIYETILNHVQHEPE